MLLKHKTAIVTGSNKGIGKQIVESFSRNGADVIACSRKKDDSQNSFHNSLMEKYKNKISSINLDLNEKDQIVNALKSIKELGKDIDILVNNASTIHSALFQMTPIKKYEEVFKTNFFSQIDFTQGVIKMMPKKKNSSIIFISSTSAIDGNEGRAAYSSSKASILSISKVLSRELGPFQIRVNSIAPGLTDTDMMRENTPEKLIKELETKIPLKRIASPAEIANAALFLASEMSSYITGQTIRVDGGMIF